MPSSGRAGQAVQLAATMDHDDGQCYKQFSRVIPTGYRIEELLLHLQKQKEQTVQEASECHWCGEGKNYASPEKGRLSVVIAVLISSHSN